MRLTGVEGLDLDFPSKFWDGVQASAEWHTCFIPEHRWSVQASLPPSEGKIKPDVSERRGWTERRSLGPSAQLHSRLTFY